VPLLNDYLAICLLVVFLVALSLPTIRDLADIIRRDTVDYRPLLSATSVLAGNADGSAKLASIPVGKQ
jgi:hypothetical protein